MIVGFHSYQLDVRGTEVALFDYARYNEELLKNESIIFAPQIGNHVETVITKFKSKFKVIFYESVADLSLKIKENSVEVFYSIKAGFNDGILPQNVRNCVHAIFQNDEIHGDRYAYVSEWLAKRMNNGKTFVPHIVEVEETNNDLRTELGIKEQEIVIGRYGGSDTFDIAFAKRLIYKLASCNKKLHFLFMNTDNFLETKRFFESKGISKYLGGILFPKNEFTNITFIRGSSDLIYKSKFINTCDAMLHARMQGESFGISCGEFSIKNKPVITCNSDFIDERSHIDILGKKGIYFQDSKSLKKAIYSIKRNMNGDFDAYSQDFNKFVVMKKFKEVFLD